MLNKRIIFMAASLAAINVPLPATAMPFCNGKAETCQAARYAAKLSPAKRRFAAECAKCWREAGARGRSVGGYCEPGCADVLGDWWVY
jgi:hypothetical protein